MNVAHVQCWTLVALYETNLGLFTRSWMSERRAVALAHILCLHRLDASGSRRGPHTIPFRDEMDLEQARCAFWAVYYSDCWASVGTGLPTAINIDRVSSSSHDREERE